MATLFLGYQVFIKSGTHDRHSGDHFLCFAMTSLGPKRIEEEVTPQLKLKRGSDTEQCKS